MLSDADIARELLSGNLRIEPPPAKAQRQPVSVDLRLGDGFLRYRSRSLPVPIGNIPADLTWAKEASPHGVALFPGEFMLATTAERVTLGDNLAGRLEGKSTLGRLGLQVHSTAGLIDPGFDGCITLEMSNVGPLALVLKPH
jgi:dCTP deaminase